MSSPRSLTRQIQQQEREVFILKSKIANAAGPNLTQLQLRLTTAEATLESLRELQRLKREERTA